MLCISRYTDDTYAQHFGDEHHKFYLEFRCNRPCLKDMKCCAKCFEKSSTTVLQHSRKFNHGNVNEPIPDNSHIYGGKWYKNAVKKWGSPPSEIIEFAIQYQKEARQGIINEESINNESINNELYMEKKESINEEMPLSKKTQIQTPDKNPAPIKHRRKPKIAPTESNISNIQHTRKPKIAPQTHDSSIHPKKEQPKKKNTHTPYSVLVNNKTQLIHKEVSLPTHIETKLEEIDSEGFRIEYVKLTLFEVGQTIYFRDIIKNKLYKKIKEKGVGSYIGRWDPDTESIISNIPDSDDEE
jgi:hypothetical protein